MSRGIQGAERYPYMWSSKTPPPQMEKLLAGCLQTCPGVTYIPACGCKPPCGPSFVCGSSQARRSELRMRGAGVQCAGRAGARSGECRGQEGLPACRPQRSNNKRSRAGAARPTPSLSPQRPSTRGLLHLPGAGPPPRPCAPGPSSGCSIELPHGPQKPDHARGYRGPAPPRHQPYTLKPFQRGGRPHHSPPACPPASPPNGRSVFVCKVSAGAEPTSHARSRAPAQRRGAPLARQSLRASGAARNPARSREGALRARGGPGISGGGGGGCGAGRLLHTRSPARPS